MALRVTIDAVEIHKVPFGPDSEPPVWLPVDDTMQTHDIMELSDDMAALLSETLVEPGRYSGVRLHFLTIEVDTSLGSRTFEIDEASAWLVYALKAFTVKSGENTDVTVEFDPASIARLLRLQTYEYVQLLRGIGVAVLASASGWVNPPGAVGSVIAVLPSGRLVASTPIQPDGSYSIPGLPALDADGEPIPYRLVARASGYESDTLTDVVLEPHEDNPGLDLVLEPLVPAWTFGDGDSSLGVAWYR